MRGESERARDTRHEQFKSVRKLRTGYYMQVRHDQTVQQFISHASGDSNNSTFTKNPANHPLAVDLLSEPRQNLDK